MRYTQTDERFVSLCGCGTARILLAEPNGDIHPATPKVNLSACIPHRDNLGNITSWTTYTKEYIDYTNCGQVRGQPSSRGIKRLQSLVTCNVSGQQQVSTLTINLLEI
ncbi:hypothetical protein RRG08_009382 [Elysia crispata]|uniref:Uncharacterized protein n=1 Tax=Elysia crispata TaxID=231223 RepID=A0AAE1DXY6_9GAST|nr:hypothetical protein RRG08_009382 [Elysia crispata]